MIINGEKLVKSTLAVSVISVLNACIILEEENNEVQAPNAEVYAKACMNGAKPITNVADFNADGQVNQGDVDKIKDVISQGIYYTLYDRNVDGVLNDDDVEMTEADIGKNSSELDQNIATLFNNVKDLQSVDNNETLRQMGFGKGTSSLAGHGEHWLNDLGNEALNGEVQSEFMRAEGLNVSTDDGYVWALFWGQNAEMDFANDATDFPELDGEWMDSQVVSFSDTPPEFATVNAHDWHTHAGLCVTEENGDIILNQHTTFNECQSMEDDGRGVDDYSTWLNIWMVHAWIFVPNPHGMFANTHACIDPDAPSEASINGNRQIPPFFAGHH